MTMQRIGYEAVVVGMQSFVSASNQVNTVMQGLNKTAQELALRGGKDFGAFGQAAELALKGTVVAIGAATTAISSLATVAVTVAATYENSMVKVQVLSGSTAQEMELLNQAIFKIGTTTNVSMQQAAEGALELAKAGFTAKQQVDGILESVVNFNIASAGEVGMAESAITIAKALSVFGLEATDASRAADALTSAAQNSVLSYKDLTRSFQQAANLADTLELSIEDLTSIIAVMGEAGLRGSDAGTSLKQAFLQLLNPSEKAAEFMNQYKINLFDANKNARPFRDLLVDLDEAFGKTALATGKITEAERAHALAVIFGSDAIRAAISSTEFGVEAFDKFKAAIENTKASDIANLFMKPTSVQVDILKNKVLSAANVFGTEFLNGIREAIIGVSTFVSTITIEDIRNFAGVLVNIAASTVIVAGKMYDLAVATASAIGYFFSFKENALIAAFAMSLIVGPAILTGIRSLYFGIATAAAAMQAFATSSLLASLAVSGLVLPIAALVTNFGGVRDSVIRLAAIGLDFFFEMLALKALGAATAVLQFAKGLTYITPLGFLVRDAIDEAQKKIDELEEKALNATDGIYGFANSLVANETIVDAFGRKIRGLSADFYGLATAMSVLEQERFEEGDIWAGSKGPRRSIYDDIADAEKKLAADRAAALKKFQEELERTTGGLNTFSGAASKAKTFLEELGVSVDQVRKFLIALNFGLDQTAAFMEALGISAAEASPLIGDLGITIAQGVAILQGLGLSAEEASARTQGLFDKIEGEKAMEKAKKDAEEAAKAYEEWMKKIEDITKSITGPLVGAFNSLFTAISGGSTVNQIFTAINTALALMESRIQRIRAIGGDTGALSTVSGIIGRAGQNIAGVARPAPRMGESAETAAEGFFSAAEAFEALATNGQDATAAIAQMEANLNLLSEQLKSLPEEDFRIAGAIMDAYRETIDAIRSGMDPATALEAIKVFEKKWIELAADSDRIRTEAYQKEMDRRKKIEEEAKETSIEIQKSKTDEWLYLLKKETEDYNKVIADRIEMEKNSAKAIINQLERVNDYRKKVREEERQAQMEEARVRFGESLVAAAAGQGKVDFSALRKAGLTFDEAAKAMKEVGLEVPRHIAELAQEERFRAGDFSGAVFFPQILETLKQIRQAEIEANQASERSNRTQEAKRTLEERYPGATVILGNREFANGGIVPGYPGEPQMILAHGRERITPSGVSAQESMMSNTILGQILSTLQRGTSGGSTYVVNANYSNTQSPASIDMDLRAMKAMTR